MAAVTFSYSCSINHYCIYGNIFLKFYGYLICHNCLAWTMCFKIVSCGPTFLHDFDGVWDVTFSCPTTHFLKLRKNNIYSSSGSKLVPSRASVKKTEGRQRLLWGRCVLGDSASSLRLGSGRLHCSPHMAVQCLQIQINLP